MLDGYSAVRKDAGIIDLSDRGKILVTGPDRSSFLNNLVTNDVASLKTGQGLHSLLLNNKGRILSDLRLFALGDAILIDTDPVSRAKTVDLFNRFHITENVTIDDRSEAWSLLSIQGPASAKHIANLTGESAIPTTEYSVIPSSIGSAEIIVARHSRTGETGYDLWGPCEPLTNLWKRLVEEKVISPIGSDALDVLRLEAGIPVYGQDMGEENIALEVNLKDAVSFTKGCYPGQEVVARATYIGKLNKTLQGILAENQTRLKKGDLLKADSKQVGTVTSAAQSPTLGKTIALGYVHRDYAKPGTRLEIREGDGRVYGEIVELPFIRKNVSNS